MSAGGELYAQCMKLMSGGNIFPENLSGMKVEFSSNLFGSNYVRERAASFAKTCRKPPSTRDMTRKVRESILLKKARGTRETNIVLSNRMIFTKF